VAVRPHQHSYPSASPSPTRIHVVSRAPAAAGPSRWTACGCRDSRNRRHAPPATRPAKRRIGVGQLGEEFVHLPPLAIPVSFFEVFSFPATTLLLSRANPVALDLLVQVTARHLQCAQRSPRRSSRAPGAFVARNARSAACLNSSNVAARSQVASSSAVIRRPPPSFCGPHSRSTSPP